MDWKSLLPWRDTSPDGKTKPDTLLIVCHKVEVIPKEFAECRDVLARFAEVDKRAECALNVTVLPCVDGAYKRLVFACTGPVHRDYDDLRRYSDAATKGMARAIQSGSKNVALLAVGSEPKYDQTDVHFVSFVGAASACYVPLEIRETSEHKRYKVDRLSLIVGGEEVIQRAHALIASRTVYCDLGGGDPERTAPPKIADYVTQVFKDSEHIKVEVVSDFDEISKNYPCMAAVNRCAQTIPRHQARIVKLTYEGKEPIHDTVYFVGKGVTIDTGGTDLKTGGAMYGMSRDKLGACAVAGFFKCAEILRPSGVKLVGFMCLVRNSIGANAYTCDEILTARSGQRIRVVNTDAEGRLTMLDPLCHAKEMALLEPTTRQCKTHLLTLATLTGHAYLTAGEPYAICMDNGPAKVQGEAARLQEAGDRAAECLEVSMVRREDFDFHMGEAETEDLRQGNTAPSTRTPRGHQTPMAFLQLGSGLVSHGTDAPAGEQLKYTHVDFAGCEKEGTGVLVGRPLGALCARWLF